jgi:hypothetical protein
VGSKPALQLVQLAPGPVAAPGQVLDPPLLLLAEDEAEVLEDDELLLAPPVPLPPVPVLLPPVPLEADELLEADAPPVPVAVDEVEVLPPVPPPPVPPPLLFEQPRGAPSRRTTSECRRRCEDDPR